MPAICTSEYAYKGVLPSLSPMHRKVFKAVLRYRRNEGRWPTAPEVHNYLVEEGSIEPNACTKARVAELKQGKNLDNPVLSEYKQIEDPERSNPWMIRPTPEAMQ